MDDALKAICPACLGAEGADLEMVSVAEQHARYAPNDPAMQRRLTEEASRSSTVYTLRRCGRCGLEYCVPMIAPKSAWYGLAYEALDLYPAERWEYDCLLARVTGADRLFEIGCGNGEFLKLCRDKGIDAWGADFSTAAVEECKAAGLDVIVLEVGDTPVQAERKATVSTAFQVLEHLDQPGKLFEHAAHATTPDATLWVAIPSNRRPTRLFGETDFLDQPPHHMTRWTEPALREIGSRFGWRLDELLYEPLGIRAALWWIASHDGFHRPANPMLAKFVRLLGYPAALVRRKSDLRLMSGFTMLGKFRKFIL